MGDTAAGENLGDVNVSGRRPLQFSHEKRQ